MVTRRIGKVLRGQATPFQLFAACVLGALLGFAPGLGQGPATFVLLVAALLVVNANLGLALVVAGLAQLAAYALAPLSFRIGRFLLDGPTAGLFESLLNAPVLAWSGLEYYAYAGGLPLGLLFGVVAGFATVRSVGAFRRRMSAAEADPGRLAQLAARPWARALTWLLFGGAGRRSWDQKLSRRVGNPVRLWGAALLVLALVGAWFAQQELAGPLAREHLVAGLERANGATVDVAGLRIDLNEGRFAVEGLALADPNALTEDLFRAASLQADVEQLDFLRRRVHVGRLVVSEARSGAPREVPGRRTRETPPPDAGPQGERSSFPGGESLEDVLADAELWRSRLGQVQDWLDRLGGERASEEEAPAGEEPSGDAPAGEESLAERLAREVRERGWFRVAADVPADAPTLRLSELVVDGLRTAHLPDRVFDLRAHELSTHPARVDAAPRVDLTSRDGAIAFRVDLAPASRGGGDGGLSFSWRGLAVDDALAQLRLPAGAPLRGGTVDLELSTAWAGGRIGHVDAPLRATFRDTVLHLDGIDPTPLEQLELSVGLSGPLDAPRVHFDPSAFTDALAAAGRSELAERLRSELGDELERLQRDAGVELPSGLGDLGQLGGEGVAGELDGSAAEVLEKPGAKRLLGGLFSGERD